ncbi:MAG: hypothetical protein LLG20_21445 [Acidobacteriales bacterium]|nr:hypothetical protein [Terriglobales bacterium]
MANTKVDCSAQIGEGCRIEDPALIGRTYEDWKQPLRLGSHAIIRPYAVIYCDTVIGNHFQCGYFCVIRAECSLADRVTLMSRVTLEGRVQIGSGTKIMAHVYIPSRTRIGERVFVGPGVTFLNDRYPLRRKPGEAVVQGPTIEDDVTIGGGCTIFPGITIGKGAFIGGGAVVTKDVPPWTLAHGVPAKHFPLPEDLQCGNRPEFMYPQTDLWGPHQDPTWTLEGRDDA